MWRPQNKNKTWMSFFQRKHLGFLFILSVVLGAWTMASPVWGIEYTEDLVDITNEGAFDSVGNPVDLRGMPDDQNQTPSAQPGFNTGDSFEDYRQTLIENWGGQKAFTEGRLKGIKENLNSELERFEDLGKSIAETEEKIAPLAEAVQTFTDQINLFNEQIRFTREKIISAERQIAEREIAMRDMMEEVQKKEVGMQVQKQAVLEYVTLLYREEEQFVDLYSNGASTLKLLLADSTVSENLMGRDYVAVMEESGRQVFHELEEQYRELREKQATLLLGQKKLSRLYATLAQEKEMLEQTRQSKKELLESTQNEKTTYESLLEESIHQQVESALAIQNMKDNMELIESKLSTLDDKLEEIKTAPIPENVPALDILLPDINDESEKFVFDWPVPPNKITADFHDPHYPKRWGIHQAIDIRARQFSEIHAPANGYVVEAKDNGTGYSYIILAHKKNLVTVYGHVYEIRVRPGMLVTKGDVIGLTGGTPGTKGAGLQTTGPHLHFEVHERGEPKNPLDYLPLYQMPIEYVPEAYLQRRQVR